MALCNVSSVIGYSLAGLFLVVTLMMLLIREDRKVQCQGQASSIDKAHTPVYEQEISN